MSASLPGVRVSGPDAGEARTYRQHLRAGRRPILGCLFLSIAWMVVGGFVVGQLHPPTLDRLAWGLAVIALWLGPPAGPLIPPRAGPRGPFPPRGGPRLVVRSHALAT